MPVLALAWRSEKAADRSRTSIWGTRKGVAAMTDSKMAAPLDPAVLSERFQTLATKSQAAVHGFLVDRPDVTNIGMGDPAKIGQAFFELTTRLAADPRPIARAARALGTERQPLGADIATSARRRATAGRRTRQTLQTPRMGRERYIQLHPRQLSSFRSRNPLCRARRKGA